MLVTERNLFSSNTAIRPTSPQLSAYKTSIRNATGARQIIITNLFTGWEGRQMWRMALAVVKVDKCGGWLSHP